MCVTPLKSPVPENPEDRDFEKALFSGMDQRLPQKVSLHPNCVYTQH
jgi:hypothetical protein